MIEMLASSQIHNLFPSELNSWRELGCVCLCGFKKVKMWLIECDMAALQ